MTINLNFLGVMSLSSWVLTTAVMIVNFIGYTVVRELKNSHGLAIRCYIFTYINPFVLYFGIEFLKYISVTEVAKYIGVIGIDYFNISSALWLQVISFDVWWTFRNLRNVDRGLRRGGNKKFIWCAMYAWIVPGFLIVPEIIVSYKSLNKGEQEVYEMLKKQLRTYIATGVYATVFLCNIFFYISMLCTMKRQKKETNALTEGSNQRHGAQKQWINLYVKLSFIMGIHMVTWAFVPFQLIGELPSWFHSIYQVTDLIHSISLFRCFVWKDSMKRALWDRFRRIVSCSRGNDPSPRIAVDSHRSNPQTPEVLTRF